VAGGVSFTVFEWYAGKAKIQLLTDVAGFLPFPDDDHIFTDGH
jgi:hypothetical protein